jgi:hypothetical protein
VSGGSARLIRGTVEVDGRPAVPDRIVAVSGDLRTVVGAGDAGPDGAFEIEVGAGVDRAVVMAGITHPVVAVAHAAVDLGAPPPAVSLAIDTRDQPFHEVVGEVEVPGAPPPFIALTVDPVHLAGVPAGLEPFFRRRAARVVDAAFLRRNLDGPRFALTLQGGTYRIDASYVDRARPELVHPGFDNYVTRLARIDGAEVMAPERYGGVEVQVARAMRITLVLRILPDEALSPGSAA